MSLFVALTGVGVAATGGNFILGMSNTADQQTSLTVTVSGNPALRVTNAATTANSHAILGKMSSTIVTGAPTAGVKGTNSSANPASAGVIGQNDGAGPGLAAIVQPGVAPLSVNSSVKVDNLNADQLDGLSSADLLQPTVVAFDEVAATIQTPMGGYASDPSSPGPSVTVTVPDWGGGTGYIEVWAQVHASPAASAVGLFDVTGGLNAFVGGQDTNCPDKVTELPPGTIPGALFITPDNDGTTVEGEYGTPEVVSQSFNDCSSAVGNVGTVLLEAAAGTRTFELQYVDCECGGTPTVSNRKLWIRVVPKP